MPRAHRGRFEPPDHFVLGHLCGPLAFVCPVGRHRPQNGSLVSLSGHKGTGRPVSLGGGARPEPARFGSCRKRMGWGIQPGKVVYCDTPSTAKARNVAYLSPNLPAAVCTKLLTSDRRREIRTTQIRACIINRDVRQSLAAANNGHVLR
jgi:hypothetical protein